MAGFFEGTRKKIARGERLRLYSRPGNDLTDRFPLIVESRGSLAGWFVSYPALPVADWRRAIAAQLAAPSAARA